jgi:flagellar hook-associated protein 3 FlgL
MLGRVTNQTSTFQAQRSLQYNAARLAQLTDQASSLKAISVPSDDPTATGQSMLVRSQQASNAQYTRNTTDGVGWLSTTDSALSDTTNILNRIRDLTVQGANDGTMSATSREAIATELTGLKSDLLSAANTTYAGRSVFAGSSDAGAAFTPGATTTDPVTGVTTTAPPAFTGTAGSSVQRRIADGTTVRVDTDGSAVFGTGTDSVFSMVDSIVSDLRSGVNISSRINDIDSRLTAVRGAWGDVGSRESQLTRAQSTLANTQTSLENQRSGIEDVDMSKVILDLKTQEVTYQSALAVTAKVIQPTLMDFLK